MVPVEDTTSQEETDRAETNAGIGPGEQDVLLREVFYTSDTERANTAGDTTPIMSRTTTEEAPIVFESSTEYEGLENDRYTTSNMPQGEVGCITRCGEHCHGCRRWPGRAQPNHKG